MTALVDILDRRDRACLGADPELFFPNPGLAEHVAIAFCSQCPIRTTCLAYALERPHLHGIWGGATADQRNLMRKYPEMVR